MNPSRSTPARYLQSLNVVICVLAVSLSGCSKSSPLEPLAKGAAASAGNQTPAAAASGYGSSSFYPLGIGNTWTYEGGGSIRAISGGDGSPGQDFSYAFTEVHRLIGTTHHEGTAYVVEEEVHQEIPESPYGPVTFWDRLRQDPQGLFSLDTLLQEPPAMDPNGIIAAAASPRMGHAFGVDVAGMRREGVSQASIERFAARVEMFREAAHGIARRGDASPPSGLELKRLVYPLHPGLNWSIRSDFPWPVRVGKMEALDTPAGKFSAFRIDVNPFGNLIQEGEWIRIWYSREGFLGYSIHTFLEGTNEDGEPTGITYVADETMKVTSMHIER